MKNSTLLLCAFLTFRATAQVSLTSATHGYVAGSTWTSNGADTSAAPGPGGTGQTWNFSTLALVGAPNSTYMMPPATTFYAASFPQATAATGIPDDCTYIESNATGNYIPGFANPWDTIIYDDPELITPFPFAYDSSMYDAYQYVMGSGSSATTVSGSAQFDGDGSGTLMLPAGNYNTLRVHLVNSATYSSLSGSYSVIEDSYTWYSAASRYPLMNITNVTFLTGPSTMTSKSVTVNTYPNAIDETSMLSNLYLFPNPATGLLSISATLPAAGNVTVELIDLTGRVVMARACGNQPAGEFRRQLDLQGIAAGMYTLRVTAGSAVSTQKLNVQ